MKSKACQAIWLRKRCANTEFSSGRYIPVFGLNTGKYGPDKTPNLEILRAVILYLYFSYCMELEY